jgi:pimeloyl-ACP methyl ester carboxylesterase
VATPLSPQELFPAGHSEISQRSIRLATGVTLRVAECGPAGGAPIVMFPGWGASLYTYRQALHLLPRRGARVTAVDLRGHGLSDKPTSPGAYSLEAYCADVDALLDALALERATLVGHSMGGAVALHYALCRPERVDAIALINPADLVALPFLPLVRATPRAVIRAVGQRLVPRFLVAWILRHVAYGKAMLVTERDIDEYWAPTQLPGFVGAVRAMLSEFDWRPLDDSRAARLAVPSVVILGASDRLIRNTAGAAGRLNGARVHVLDGGHCVHEERPDVVYRLIADITLSRGTAEREGR